IRKKPVNEKCAEQRCAKDRDPETHHREQTNDGCVNQGKDGKQNAAANHVIAALNYNPCGPNKTDDEQRQNGCNQPETAECRSDRKQKCDCQPHEIVAFHGITDITNSFADIGESGIAFDEVCVGKPVSVIKPLANNYRSHDQREYNAASNR